MSVRITGDYTHDKSNPRNGHRLIPGSLTGSPVLSNVFDTNAGLQQPEERRPGGRHLDDGQSPQVSDLDHAAQHQRVSRG